jgi:hypothetical protein
MRCRARRDAVGAVAGFGEGGIASEKLSAHDCPIAWKQEVDVKKNLLARVRLVRAEELASACHGESQGADYANALPLATFGIFER